MRHRARLLTVALTCALALAGCGDQPSDDAGSAGGTGSDQTADGASAGASDGTTAEPAGTEIPDSFPLAVGMGGPADTIATSRTGTGLRDLRICDTAPLRGLGIRDRMVADNSGGESANARELVLLGNPQEAALVAEAFADLSVFCDTTTVRSSTKGDLETVTEVRASPFRPAPAATLVQTYTFDGEPGPGATVVHVVPVGAALLVTSTYGEWTGQALEEGVAETVDALRRTVAALDMFDDGSTPSSQASPETGPTESETVSPGVRAIPEDFPLGIGLPADGGDFEVAEPSADGEGMGEVEMCGQVVWPIGGTAGGTRRLVTGAHGPEYVDGRELLVHADAEVAANAMAAIRRAAKDCRSVENQVWTQLDRDTGYDTVTVGLTYADGLGSSVFQVTRVGSARLMVHTYGEGSLESLPDQADGVTATTEKIVPAMCVFTKTGC